MPSFAQCLRDASKKVRDSDKLEKRLADDVSRRTALLQKGGTPKDVAEQQARIAAINARISHLKEVRYQTVMQVRAQREFFGRMEAHPNGRLEGIDAQTGRDRLETSSRSIEQSTDRNEAVVGTLGEDAVEVQEAMRSTILGNTPGEAALADAVDVASGRPLADIAAEKGAQYAAKVERLAGGWKKISDHLFSEAQRLGSSVKHRADWVIEQIHDAKRVAPPGMDRIQARSTWVKFVKPLLDRQRTLNASGAPLKDSELDEYLGAIFDHIRTGGQSSGRGVQAMKNRHNHPRTLALDGWEARRAYRETYGEPNVGRTIKAHIQNRSRENATMEIAGPNHEATLEAALQEVAVKGQGGTSRGLRRVSERLGREVEREASMTKFVRSRWHLATEAGEAPQSDAVARAMSAQRSLLVSAQLGAAMLSSFSDLGTTALTAYFNGVPVFRSLMAGFKAMNPANGEHRKAMRLFGAAVDVQTARLRASGVQFDGAGTMARISNTVLRASGLPAWTDGLKSGYMMAHMGTVGDLVHRDLGFDAADNLMKGGLKRYGFTKDDWKLLKAVGTDELDGVRYANGNRITQSGLPKADVDRLNDRLLTMIRTEGDLAVPEPGVRTRSQLRLGAPGDEFRPGAAGTEIVTALGMYKSFSLEMMNGHFARALAQDTTLDTLKYMGLLGLTTTAMGGLSRQAKLISKGQRPDDIDSPEFWGAAAMQGGGLGIFGDFIASGGQANRYGSGLIKTLAGPQGQFLDDAFRVVAATDDIMMGDQALTGRAVSFLGRYTPGSSLWQTRLLLHRAIFDSAREAVDPRGARRSFAAMERFQRENGGNGYFFEPGQSVSDFLGGR